MKKEKAIRLIDKNCVGCGACSNIDGIKGMSLNDDGFLRPALEASFDFKKLKEICPIFYSNNEDIKDMWGKYLDVCSSFSTDPEILKTSSSGGVITSLLRWLVDQKIVDGVFQIGHDDNNPFLNKCCKNETSLDVLKCSGSRYSPASVLEKLFECIEDDKKYVVVGKPCEIRGLNKYLAKNPSYSKNIFLKISFFCAGTPSLHASENMALVMGADLKTVKYVSYRGNGWPGFATIKDDKGTYKMKYEESWGTILGRTKQQFCRICCEGTGEEADISCGDNWILDKNLSPIFEESEGRNIVFLRTKIGKGLFERCAKDGVLNVRPFDIGLLKHIQPYQFERKSTLLAQIMAMRLCGKYTPNYSTKGLLYLSHSASLKKNISIFFGTIKRIKKGTIK